ncbi:protein Shroom3 [Ambystoma mexicanum]|uniref:protein Shroom3 n=1 Tax=Ambystoma mexicanum TaxID=8296 RepID=UPI0037E8C203
MMQISQGTLGTPWHQTYHSSSSTSDLSSYDHAYLRRSPDQYSSRGSMESLDHVPAGYPCHLSPAKSSNSIDQLAHLHNKRDSAYSSFSTNSSIPEYQLPAFCKERSFSMENMHSRCSPHERMKQADIKYIKTVYDAQRGVSEEYEVHSSSVLKNREGQKQADGWTCGRSQGKARIIGVPAWNAQHQSMPQMDHINKGAPLPPARSDSYAAIRHREIASSGVNLDGSKSCLIESRGLRPQPLTNTASDLGKLMKAPFAEGYLRTVLETSPETSPSNKSKPNYSQAPQPGQPMLPTGVYPVPTLEPHFAQVPQNNNVMLYPALAKESGYKPPTPVHLNKVTASEPSSNPASTQQTINSRLTVSSDLEGAPNSLAKEDATPIFAEYRLHSTPNQEVATFSLGRSKCELCPPNKQLQLSREITKQTEYSLCTTQQAPHMHLRSASEGKVPSPTSDHWRSEVQEERETNRWRRERESQDRTYWASGKSKQAITSLQSNPDMCSRTSSAEVKEIEACDGHLAGKGPSDGKGGEDCWRQADIQSPDLDRQDITQHNDGRASTPPLHNPQAKYDKPSSPVDGKAHEFSRSRLSSSSSQSSQGFHFGKPEGGKMRCSVLEKISKIEQREQESQRSQGTGGLRNSYNNGLSRSSQSSSARSSLNSLEDLRSKFAFHDQSRVSERTRSMSTTTSTKTSVRQPQRRTVRARSEEAQGHPMEEAQLGKQHGKCEVYGFDSQKTVQGRTADLQEIKGALGKTDYDDTEEQWKDGGQDHSESQLDTQFNRTYRNSIKDAQSKVLRATSFRRKDLDISPPFVNKSKMGMQRLNSARDGGKTATASPHVPKERHSITPTESSSGTLEYANKVARIGGRKRMSEEKKKRSYSEPEKMNEVGVTDGEQPPNCSDKKGMQFTFPENTVADRRRIFERDNKTCSTINLSKPELKQLQQNALADYIERKTGRRPTSQETRYLKERSQSSYFQTNIQDDESLSSASSMNSLQDQALFSRWRDPVDQPSIQGRVSSTLPPGLTGCFDLNSFEQKTGSHERRCRSSSFANLNAADRYPEKSSKLKHSQSSQIDHYEQLGRSHFMNMERPFEKPSPSKNSSKGSVKSVSAEDLLDRSDHRTFMLHVRSSSSPSTETRSQDVMLEREIRARLAKDPICSVGPNISPSKHEDRGVMEHTNTRQYSHQDVGESGTQLQETSGMSFQRNSPRVSESPNVGRTTGLSPLACQPIQLTGRKSSPGPCRDHASPAEHVHTTQNYGAHPPSRMSGGSFQLPEEHGRTVVSSSDKSVLSSPVGWKYHDKICPTGSKEEKIKKKPSPPQRPPPPKIKWACSVQEDHSPNTTSQSSMSGLKSFPRWQSLGAQSSTSSELETSPSPSPSNGRISLRISESCLQPTSPLVHQDEEDDDVFITETEVGAAEAVFEPPLSSPPLAISIEDSAFSRSLEEFPLPPPDVIEDDTQMVGKQEAPGEGSTSCNFLEEKIVFSEPSGEFRRTNSMNSEEPLSVVSSETSLPSDLNTQQHLSASVEEFQNTNRLPAPQRDSPMAEIILSQYSDTRHHASESCSSTCIKIKPITPEEMKSQQLAKEIISKDRSLVDVLDPDSKMKTTMDLMEGLFPNGSSFLKENNAKRKKMQKPSNRPAPKEDLKEETEVGGNAGSLKVCHSDPPPKAEVLSKVRDLQADVKERGGPISLDAKKNELIGSLTKKLEVLNEAKESLLADIKLNNALGEDVEALIKGLCKPNEFDKYTMFIGDLDKVVSLLLSLSGRLARVENVLSSLGDDATADEKDSLNKKRKVLAGQHEDARELKENLDRRERVVLDILGKYLSEGQLQDYQHFVKMKSALLIEQRELDDKMKLGQEQLRCLMESLHLEHSPRGAVPSSGTKVSSVDVVNLLTPLTASL